MNYHLFWMYGMWGPYTDAGSRAFVERIEQELSDIDVHDSPYRDYEAGKIAALIDKLPLNDGVFVGGTSLGCNDTAVVCNYVHRSINGAFGFQASLFGPKGFALNANVKFAHLIYSYNPLALGLGAYRWPLGTMNPQSYHKTPHHLPHPGDGNTADQTMFIREMRAITRKRE
jgi:hypothetical protein